MDIRWGGEEFLIICPETTLQSARELAQYLKEEIENYNFDSIDKQTASFGVNEINKRVNSIDKLIKGADEALYRAKNGGRNQVIVSK